MSNVVKRITDELVKKYRPEKVILFGSYVMGNNTKDSDIDLFVVKKTNRSYSQRVYQAYQSIDRVHDQAVDIIVYTPKEVKQFSFPGAFAQVVFEEGKLLYDKTKQ